MNAIFAASLSALALAVTAHGQNRPRRTQATPPAAAAPATKSEPFVLEAGTVQLAELIDRVAAYLDYDLLYDEQEMAVTAQRGIRLTRRTEVDRAGCWELFNSLLYRQGFAILPVDRDRGFYDVVFISGQRGREIGNAAMFVPYNEVDGYAQLRAVPILTSVPLQHVNATIASNALRPFFASSGGPPGACSLTLGNVGNSSALLLQGFGPQVAAACQLLRLVDRGDEGYQPKVQVVVLEHAAAQDIVARVEDTLVRGSAQAAAETGMGTQLRVVPHPSLNAIVLSGSAKQIDDALGLIARLDLPATNANASAHDDDLRERLEQLEQRVRKLEQAQRGGA